MAEELALDLEELRQLQSLAKRPRVLSFISSQIRNLEKLSKEPVSSSVPISSVVRVLTSPAINYSTLASFSWDQDSDNVKLYVSLHNVDQEKIQAEFKSISFDVKFHDVQGKNFRCAIPRLNKKIIPEKC